MGNTSFTIELRPGRPDQRVARRREAVAEVLRDDLAQGVARVAERARARAAERTPARTGDARDGWVVEPGADRYTFRLLNKLARTRRGLAKLLALEFGTRPHEISARRARALRFEDDGGRVTFRRMVRHPGTRAYAMVRVARGIAAVELQELGRQIGRDAVRAWGRP